MDWILDRLLPRYEFRTRYTWQIAASPEAVWAAVGNVTAEELPVTRLLMRVRSGGRSRLAGALLDAMTIPELGRREEHEIVLGRVAKFWCPRPVRGPEHTQDPAAFTAFAEPGWAKAAMSFQLTPTPAGTVLAAETRVTATDEASRRRFAAYWTLIRLGGAGLIRLELLRAVARRAERSEP
jgi:hypothetical protein